MLKKLSFTIITTVLILAIALFLITIGSTNEPKDTPASNSSEDPVCFKVIGLHTITLKDSSKENEFETFLKEVYHPLTNNNFPGMRFIVVKADRGSKIGEYMLLGIFDSAKRRDYHFPADGKRSEELEKQMDELGVQKIINKLYQYIGSSWISDYHVVEDVDQSPQMVIQGSVSDPACFGLIGLFNVTLKDSSKADEFETFLKEVYNPLGKENFPGMRFIAFKADRGPKIGEYMVLAVFDSAERRDYYYPAEGKKPEEVEKKEEELGVQKIIDKFRGYARLSWVSDFRVIE